jgi:hypothetical protein
VPCVDQCIHTVANTFDFAFQCPEKSNFGYMHAVCVNLQEKYLVKAATDVQNKIKDAERKKIENKPKVRRLG